MGRDWSSYNDGLVREVWLFFSKKVLDSLKRFDVGVRGVGRPPYPNSLIILLALIRSYFKLPYRQTEGLARMLLEKLGVKVPDYSTLNMRIRNLTILVASESNPTLDSPKDSPQITNNILV